MKNVLMILNDNPIDPLGVMYLIGNVKANFSPDNNAVYVTIEFRILNIATIQSVSLILNRTR